MGMGSPLRATQKNIAPPGAVSLGGGQGSGVFCINLFGFPLSFYLYIYRQWPVVCVAETSLAFEILLSQTYVIFLGLLTHFWLWAYP